MVTVSRSDYGIYLPILRQIVATPGLALRLFVGGTHLSDLYGATRREIEADGFPVAAEVDTLPTSDSDVDVAESSGKATSAFARAFGALRPDMVLVLGDRIDMHAAALAALPMKIPVAHVHGGERTTGAIDDALRHGITKLSHLHFVSTEAYRRRVLQLGEEPWRVTVSGAPALDNLRQMTLFTAEELRSRGVPFEAGTLLVTFHPVTLEYEDTDWQTDELLAAIDEIDCPVLFTMPNSDTHASAIVRRIEAFVATRARARMVKNLGTRAYFSVMAQAGAMVGNSSSGIIEAPSFRLPVVNVGARQEGRVRAANVIDVGHRREDIVRGIRAALEPSFRARLDAANPYGIGTAAEHIVDRLATIEITDALLRKTFTDL